MWGFISHRRRRKKKGKKELHCYTSFFFGGYMCVYKPITAGAVWNIYFGPAAFFFSFVCCILTIRISKDCFHLKEKSSFVWLRVSRVLSDKETFFCQSDDVCHYRQYTFVIEYRVRMKEERKISPTFDPFSFLSFPRRWWKSRDGRQ